MVLIITYIRGASMMISSTHHSWEALRLSHSCPTLRSIGTQLPAQLMCRTIYEVSMNLQSTII